MLCPRGLTIKDFKALQLIKLSLAEIRLRNVLVNRLVIEPQDDLATPPKSYEDSMATAPVAWTIHKTPHSSTQPPWN
jgi:hypothetical protein